MNADATLPPLQAEDLEPQAVATDARRSRLRGRRRGILLLAATSFAIDTALLALFWLAGSIPAVAVLAYGLAGAVVCTLLFALAATGFSDRSRDPYLTALSLALSSAVIVVAAAALPQVGLLLLMLLFIVLAFGALRLSWRDATAAVALLAVAVITVVMVSGPTLGLPLDSAPERLVSGVWIALVMARCTMLGWYGARIRQRLNQRNRSLQTTNAAVQRLATCDELTGLPNRRSILQCVRQAMQRCDRPDAALAVALFDLDHFKAINDTHGHALGDEVLRQFGAVVLCEMRGDDRLGRYGGEEFLLLLRGVRSGADAVQVAERMRAAVARHTWSALGPGLAVTASVGVALVRPGDTPEALIARADLALYEAKREGRDRTRLGD
jgi:diguanylate cyclase (GGDEF)-like protein